MTTRVISTEADREGAVLWLQAHKLPFTLNLLKGKHRTDRQNRLQRKWMQEIAEQLDDETPEYWRGYCKAYFGVPILLAEDPEFAEFYEKHIRGLDYETKIALMQEPADIAVTRHMTTEQKTRYLDAIVRHFAEQGVRLTHPDDQGRVT